MGPAAARRSNLTHGRGPRCGHRSGLQHVATGGRGAFGRRARHGAPVLSTVELERLFVYGTLMTGFSRRPLLGDAAVLEGPARIRGSLYDFGEYPGVVLDDGGWVAGELYRVPDLGTRLPELDRTEWYDPANETASLYVRRRVAVVGAAGGREAWVYMYNGPPGRGPLIPSGDWRGHAGAGSR